MSSLTPNWDPLDPIKQGEPPEVHQPLREKCPVAWSDRFGGFYALTRYEHVLEAALDVETFSSQKATIPDVSGPGRPLRGPLEVDPPVHGHYREVLNRFFTPDRIHHIEPVIRRAARDLIGRCIALGESDVVESFAFRMPVEVQCIFLGVSIEDAGTIQQLAHKVVEAGAAEDAVAHKDANDQIYAYIDKLIEARRKTPYDANDLISALINEPVGGKALTHAEVAGVIRIFLQAGHTATASALASAIRYLGSCHADQQRLRERPSDIPLAVEEVLRMWTPARAVGRKTTRDVEIAGTIIPKGSKVGLMLGAANRDPAVFQGADTVDIGRRPNKHVALGYGIHRCVGASLARAQLRIALEELLSMTDEFVLIGDTQWSSWSHLGPSTLPIKFTARSLNASDPALKGGRELAMSVAAIRPLAERIIELELRNSTDGMLPEWTPGAHIDIVLPGNVSRSYSLVSEPLDRQCWRIAVLRETAGRGGSDAVHRLKAGDAVRVRRPSNKFELKPAHSYHFLASGIGITPILSMIDAARAQGIPWRLDYVGRARHNLAYLERVANSEEAHMHFTSERGRPNLSTLLAATDSAAEIYACGSQGFLLDLEAAAVEAGRAFHAEWFAPRPGARQGAEGAYEAFTVWLQRSKVEVAVHPGQSIIDASAEAGVAIPASCFEGTCGACLSTVLEGVPDHRDSFLSPSERKGNCLMAACVSKSMTARLVLDW